MAICRDDIPICFVEATAHTIALAKYGQAHRLRGHCYAIKEAARYVGILLIGEAIEAASDPAELRGTGYFRLIGLVIDKQFRRQGIGKSALTAAMDNIFKEYGNVPILLSCHRDNHAAHNFYVKMGFNNVGFTGAQDCFYVKA